MREQCTERQIRTILVAVDGYAEEDRALQLLSETLDPNAVRLRIAHTLLVPDGVPLHVSMPAAEDHAACIVKHAREIAGRYGIQTEGVILRGRDAAECLAGEAREAAVDEMWILFRHGRAPWGHRLLRETLTELLGAVPCPVMIAHLPHLRAAGEAAGGIAIGSHRAASPLVSASSRGPSG
jgi:nucleotide-binding universal stress UspA family protein